MTVADPVRVETLVDMIAAQRPHHPALLFGERRWTYIQLRIELDRRAARLVEAGLRTGDVVATTEAASDDLAISFLACCRAGLTLLPLSAALTRAEVTPLFDQAHARIVLTADGNPHPAQATLPSLPLRLHGPASDAATQEAMHRSRLGTPDEIAAILATSGTTGTRPKLVCVPHREHTWRRTTPAWWETADGIYYTPRRNLFITWEFSGVLMVGGTTLLSHATSPTEVEAEMSIHRATILWTVPALLRLLTEQTRPPQPGIALQIVRTVAAPLSPAVARAAARRYRATVIQGYGSTEAAGMMGTPMEGAPEESIGTPYPGVEARIVDESGTEVTEGDIGELVVRSPGLMLGYLDDPEATDRALRDGWLWTGDLARRDTKGYYYLSGRNALRINVNGFKVSPEEVEAVLEMHPAVREAAVLAAPDATHGEVVRAVIVPNGIAPSVAELRRFCRGRLAAYKVPRLWEFHERLPRSPLGKIRRHLL